MEYKFKTFIATVFSALILFFLYVFRETPKNAILHKESFWAEKLIADSSYDIVFIGDSRVYRGISPVPFHDRNIPAYNMGFSACPVVSSIVNASLGKLNPDGKSIIVLAYNPKGLSNGFSTLSFDEYANLPYSELFVKYNLYPLLSPFDRVNNNELLNWSGRSINEAEYFLEHGWVAVKSNNKLKATTYINKHLMHLQSLRLDSTKIKDFFFITDSLVKCNYKVYGIRVPTNPRLAQLEDSVLKFDNISFIEEFERNGGEFISNGDSTYCNYDASHLDSINAIRYSNYLATFIFKQLEYLN